MKRLVVLGSILGTLAVFLAACFFVAITLIWLIWQWEPARWVVWAVGLGMMVVAVALIWRWWRLPVERRFRFSMRGMLAGMALFALWFGVVGTDVLRWGRMSATLADLAGHGVTVEYFYHYPRDPLRDLALRLFGFDLREEVQVIEIRRDQGLAALLEHAGDLPDLEAVGFYGGGISDAGLVHVEALNQFPEVRLGGFGRCMITDEGLERLTAWKGLEDLHLHNCAKITDDGLAHLKELPSLRKLTLLQGANSGTLPVTDSGLAHVADLRQLQELWISRVPITDAGLDQLREMPNLERVLLYKTKATEAGVRRLCEALPDCLVIWEEAWFPAICQIRCIEIWRVGPVERLLATITDVDQIAAIKAWLEEASKERYPNCSGSPAYWRDGRGGACLSVRFEGRRRRMYEVGLGNGVYSVWEKYCDLTAADDEEIRALLGVDVAEWSTGEAVD